MEQKKKFCKDIKKQESWSTTQANPTYNQPMSAPVVEQRLERAPQEPIRMQEEMAAPTPAHNEVYTEQTRQYQQAPAFTPREQTQATQVYEQPVTRPDEITRETRRMYDSRFDQEMNIEKPAENQTSSLARSIQSAANRYSSAKTETPVEDVQTSRREDIAASNRTKSIAEKLGFINFDEEELDTPSFLRKENALGQQDSGHNVNI